MMVAEVARRAGESFLPEQYYLAERLVGWHHIDRSLRQLCTCACVSTGCLVKELDTHGCPYVDLLASTSWIGLGHVSLMGHVEVNPPKRCSRAII